MNVKNLVAVGAVLFASTVLAEAGIVNTVVRQRWPWSPKVDVEFTVTGETTDVALTATYDGAIEPLTLQEKDIEGQDLYDLEPGVHHIVWDPVSAGFGETELKNFSITVTPTSVDRTYLILDLKTGAYEYAASEPDGGWKSASSDYYRLKMVLRRIPKGTFWMGYPADMLTRIGSNNPDQQKWHQATLSSDYYISVYPVTVDQQLCATGTVAGIDVQLSKAESFCNCNYDTLRGTVAAGINWPSTGYRVAEDSVINAYRTLTKNAFPKEWVIDLPTAAQWERAGKATTPTNQYWVVGGTVDSTDVELTNFVNQVAVWSPNKSAPSSTKVGQLTPNGWGLYDIEGLCFEWNLDWMVSGVQYLSGVDPVGPTSASNNCRIRRSSYASGKNLFWCTAAYINNYGQDNTNPGYRLCITLKPIKFE